MPGAISFGEALRTFARIGLLSFGGPAGQIALMHKVLVEEKKWLDEKRFLHALNFCMLLPGPEAMQLATWCGWTMHGVRGGIVAGTLFVLPGFVVMVGLSAAYALLGETPLVGGLMFGLKAAVLAVVLEALSRVSKRALKGRASIAVAIVAFVAIAVLRLPFPLVIGLAALAGYLMRDRFAAPAQVVVAAPLAKPLRHVALVTLAGMLLWGLPLLGLLLWFGRGHVLAEEGLYFSKAAVVTFGGAYAVLAYVAQQAVEVYGWLTGPDMVTGLGLAETTPGPLILVLVFVGFLGAFHAPGGLDPVIAGLAGATVAVWMTFVPCFLWVFAGAPFIEQLRGNRALAGALSAITAAVVGVIANLSIWFGLQVLFGELGDFQAGPLQFWMPNFAQFDWRAGLIFAASAAWLWRHGPLLPMLALAALAGFGLRLF
jgi:chromate transporter